jgi:hypothetical protein
VTASGCGVVHVRENGEALVQRREEGGGNCNVPSPSFDESLPARAGGGGGRGKQLGN